MNKKIFQDGFTLAEVLITLGIIGVVAAMTLPTLIGKYQMKSFEVAFKKQYAVLQDTFNYLNLEEGLTKCYVYLVPQNGDIPSHYAFEYSECSTLQEELVNKLNLQEIEYFHKYAKQSDVLTNGGAMVNGSVTHDFSSPVKAYLSKDGAIYILGPNQGGNMIDRNRSSYIVLDVNGSKKPNKWGYDVFWLTIVLKNNKIMLTDELASLIEKGGRFPRDILRNQNNDPNKPVTFYWK